MDIRAVAFDVNGTLVRILTDDGAEEVFLPRLEADELPGELALAMARLDPIDLETTDTLITAGLAANRAQAVRWALARIRERPVYAQLREGARSKTSSPSFSGGRVRLQRPGLR